QRDHLARGFLPGRRSLAAVPFVDTQVSQYLIECPVLFYDNYDMLDRRVRDRRRSGCWRSVGSRRDPVIRSRQSKDRGESQHTNDRNTSSCVAHSFRPLRSTNTRLSIADLSADSMTGSTDACKRSRMLEGPGLQS